MSRRWFPLVTAALAVLASAACATWLEGAERLARRLQSPFAYASIDAPTLRPGPGERIVVDQALLLVDATASISAGTLFPRMQTRVADFAAAMPDGSFRPLLRVKDAQSLLAFERDARAVRDSLVARGVDPARLRVRGFGESRPIAPNDTEAGRARDRRVELTPIA